MVRKMEMQVARKVVKFAGEGIYAGAERDFSQEGKGK